jgi:LytS/YehU family sensor histidine kinase
LNVRNAAPLTAGLIFGWPSGLIAGLVGGIERWFSNAGDYTRLACTIGTVVAGIFGAGVRKFMMDNRKASWFYGLAVGVTTEVLHMLLVFLTNAADIQRAVTIVKICAIPMIAANLLAKSRFSSWLCIRHFRSLTKSTFHTLLIHLSLVLIKSIEEKS